MKKRILNLKMLVFIASAVFFTACPEGGSEGNPDGSGTVKLLKAITDNDGWSQEYVYDSQNRITKISEYENGKLDETRTLSYKGNDLVKIVYVDVNNPQYNSTIEITTNGNKITCSTDESNCTVDLNSDGFPVKYEEVYDNGDSWSEIYQYQSGNLSKYSIKDIYNGKTDEWNYTYKYDKQTSPFYHCNTPKWFMFWWFDCRAGKNNVTDETRNNETRNTSSKTTFTYTYDKDGFPTSYTETYEGSSGSTSEYEYELTYIKK